MDGKQGMRLARLPARSAAIDLSRKQARAAQLRK